MIRVALFTVASLLPTVTMAQGAIPSSLPETRKLDGELARLEAETGRTAAVIQRMIQEARSARQEVDRAIQTTTRIRQMDDRLNRLIRQLRPYESVPKVRNVVQVLAKNLATVKSSIHSVRGRTDALERDALRPMAKRLQSFEANLTAKQVEVISLKNNVGQARANLAKVASHAEKHAVARSGLERAARNTRTSIQPITSAMVDSNRAADGLVNQLANIKTVLASVGTAQNALANMDRQMKPAEKIVGDLDRAMSKRVSIKLPWGEEVGFTVRQVIEKPGQIAGVVLKPIEGIVNGILEPILKKLRVEIHPPAGLDTMVRGLDAFAAARGNLERSLRDAEAKLNKEIERAVRFNNLLNQFPLNGSTR